MKCVRRMAGEDLPRFESYLGAAALACGVTWLWDYFASLYFPGQTALNFTLLSALIYLEAAFLGAFGLTRRRLTKHLHVGVRAGIGAWMTNMVFRLIVFDLSEALWGVLVYLTSFLVGGCLGGLFASMIHRGEAGAKS